MHGGDVALRDAAESFFANANDGLTVSDSILYTSIIPMFQAVANAPRFRDMRLSAFVNLVDKDVEIQFCALTVSLGDRTTFVAFRGTDGTLIAWKENFKMSYCEAVPAQLAAAEYLKYAARRTRGKLRVGGHSKGGNLAVYSSMKAPPLVRMRIAEIYSFDGPGFLGATLQTSEYRSISGRIKKLIPQSSIVGMLLEHGDEYDVVKSSESGPLQHNGFTWEVDGPGFVRLPCVDSTSRNIDRTIKAWINGLDYERRREFVETFFDLLEQTGAKTVAELTSERLRTALTLVGAIGRLDRQSRAMMIETIGLLVRENRKNGEKRPKPAGDKPRVKRSRKSKAAE